MTSISGFHAGRSRAGETKPLIFSGRMTTLIHSKGHLGACTYRVPAAELIAEYGLSVSIIDYAYEQKRRSTFHPPRTYQSTPQYVVHHMR